MNRELWEAKVDALNKLHVELQNRPSEFKRGYQLSHGGILNAYREGDVSFIEALKELQHIIILPPEQFLKLKQLINVFSIARETKGSFGKIELTPHGKIEWTQGGDIIIHLGE